MYDFQSGMAASPADWIQYQDESFTQVMLLDTTGHQDFLIKQALTSCVIFLLEERSGIIHWFPFRNEAASPTIQYPKSFMDIQVICEQSPLTK